MQRLRQLQAALQRSALITNFTDGVVNPNFLYCTGYDGFGCLFIPQRGTPILFAPAMEIARARRSGLTVRKFTKDSLKSLKGKGSMGIDYEHTDLTLGGKLRKLFPKMESISPLLERQRLVKDASELRALAKACQISDQIYAATFKQFRKFKTELEVANFMNAEAAKHGVPLSFDTIVASGPNAAIPHHKPTTQKLRKGFCVIDFGVKVEGYCSDTTRTFFIGKPTRRDRMLYAFVLRAQESAITKSKTDRRCAELHRTAESALGTFKKYFIHSLGHGVGLQIHEAPALGPYSKHLLADHVPFTIEPGIYLPKKLGIRIEDTLVLKRGTPVLLTKFTKQLLLR